jgi:hypothetical protein
MRKQKKSKSAHQLYMEQIKWGIKKEMMAFFLSIGLVILLVSLGVCAVTMSILPPVRFCALWVIGLAFRLSIKHVFKND